MENGNDKLIKLVEDIQTDKDYMRKSEADSTEESLIKIYSVLKKMSDNQEYFNQLLTSLNHRIHIGTMCELYSLHMISKKELRDEIDKWKGA